MGDLVFLCPSGTGVPREKSDNNRSTRTAREGCPPRRPRNFEEAKALYLAEVHAAIASVCRHRNAAPVVLHIHGDLIVKVPVVQNYRWTRGRGFAALKALGSGHSRVPKPAIRNRK